MPMMYHSFANLQMETICTSGAKYAQTPSFPASNNNSNNNHLLTDVIMTSDLNGSTYHSIYSYVGDMMTSPMTSLHSDYDVTHRLQDIDMLPYQSSRDVIKPAEVLFPSFLYPLEPIRCIVASEDLPERCAGSKKKGSPKRRVKVERTSRTKTKTDLRFTRYSGPAEKRRYKEDDHVTQWLNEQTCDGNVKRRRKVSRPQRLAANERERKRMDSLNQAFSELRAHIPVRSQDRRLSRIQTLRFAIDYIALMMDLLRNSEEEQELSE